jgi:hypothetical protein
MTDSPGLPPEQERVRRLLAAARHDAPVPPEVAARLDETLASLVSERGGAPLEDSDTRSDEHAPVVDLGARRRRRAGIGLLAAAAVVVAGVAVGQALPRMSGSDDASSSAGVAADSGGSDRELGGDRTDGGADSSSGAEAPESMKSQAPTPLLGAPTLSSSDTDLSDDLLTLREGATPRSGGLGSADALSSCDLRGIGRGRRVVARVDGQLGVVVFRRPDGAAQEVALYVCGTPEPVRTLTLPAP